MNSKELYSNFQSKLDNGKANNISDKEFYSIMKEARAFLDKHMQENPIKVDDPLYTNDTSDKPVMLPFESPDILISKDFIETLYEYFDCVSVVGHRDESSVGVGNPIGLMVSYCFIKSFEARMFIQSEDMGLEQTKLYVSIIEDMIKKMIHIRMQSKEIVSNGQMEETASQLSKRLMTSNHKLLASVLMNDKEFSKKTKKVA